MSLFRSEEIKLYKFKVAKDEEWRVMSKLGQLNNLHFVNLNANTLPFHLSYTEVIKRAEASLMQVNEIEQLCGEYGIYMKPCENINEFLDQALKLAT